MLEFFTHAVYNLSTWFTIYCLDLDFKYWIKKINFIPFSESLWYFPGGDVGLADATIMQTMTKTTVLVVYQYRKTDSSTILIVHYAISCIIKSPEKIKFITTKHFYKEMS